MITFLPLLYFFNEGKALAKEINSIYMRTSAKLNSSTQSPIPNPQSPLNPNYFIFNIKLIFKNYRYN